MPKEALPCAASCPWSMEMGREKESVGRKSLQRFVPPPSVGHGEVSASGGAGEGYEPEILQRNRRKFMMVGRSTTIPDLKCSSQSRNLIAGVFVADCVSPSA